MTRAGSRSFCKCGAVEVTRCREVPREDKAGWEEAEQRPGGWGGQKAKEGRDTEFTYVG